MILVYPKIINYFSYYREKFEFEVFRNFEMSCRNNQDCSNNRSLVITTRIQMR